MTGAQTGKPKDTSHIAAFTAPSLFTTANSVEYPTSKPRTPNGTSAIPPSTMGGLSGPREVIMF